LSLDKPSMPVSIDVVRPSHRPHFCQAGCHWRDLQRPASGGAQQAPLVDLPCRRALGRPFPILPSAIQVAQTECHSRRHSVLLLPPLVPKRGATSLTAGPQRSELDPCRPPAGARPDPCLLSAVGRSCSLSANAHSKTGLPLTQRTPDVNPSTSRPPSAKAGAALPSALAATGSARPDCPLAS
jgi:hypothetical protein